MKVTDFLDMAGSRATGYQELQLQAEIKLVNPNDGRAFDLLGSLLVYKGVAPVLETIALAGKVTPSGPIGSTELQAAIGHAFPSEAIQIVAGAR